MIKNLNTYYLGFCCLIVLLQMIIPPSLRDSYSYFLFLFGIFLINGGYRFLRIKLGDNSPKNYFNKSDIDLLVFSLNIIGVSTFLYFLYMHMIILPDSIDNPSGLKTQEYVNREVSYFMTREEYDALHFWEFSTFTLIPFSLIVTIVSGFIKKNASKTE